MYSQAVLLTDKSFHLLCLFMLTSPEANLFYELTISHTLNNTSFIDQALQLKLNGFRSPSVFHKDYAASPFFQNYGNFDEYIQKACKAAF
jgi:hypothetical protein